MKRTTEHDEARAEAAALAAFGRKVERLMAARRPDRYTVDEEGGAPWLTDVEREVRQLPDAERLMAAFAVEVEHKAQLELEYARAVISAIVGHAPVVTPMPDWIQAVIEEAGPDTWCEHVEELMELMVTPSLPGSMVVWLLLWQHRLRCMRCLPDGDDAWSVWQHRIRWSGRPAVTSPPSDDARTCDRVRPGVPASPGGLGGLDPGRADAGPPHHRAGRPVPAVYAATPSRWVRPTTRPDDPTWPERPEARTRHGGVARRPARFLVPGGHVCPPGTRQATDFVAVSTTRLACVYVLGDPVLRRLPPRRRVPLDRRPPVAVRNLRIPPLRPAQRLAQDRETSRPGPITRGPLTIRLYRRTPRREVCAAGTFLDRSQPPDN